MTGYFARCRADYLRIAPLPRAMSALRRDLRAMWHREPAYTKAELAAITVPTTIADGEHDEYVKRGHPEALAKLIAGARLVRMPAVSHFAPWQDPTGFAEMIIDAVTSAKDPQP